APSVQATATATTASNAVTGFTSLVGGTGYSSANPPSVTITGGSGNGATAVVLPTQISPAGAVTGITVVTGGTGYTGTPTVTIAPPPNIVTAGVPFGLTIAAQDLAGNVDTTFNGPVTLALVTNGDGPLATLGGTLTATAVNGVATFSGLTLNR